MVALSWRLCKLQVRFFRLDKTKRLHWGYTFIPDSVTFILYPILGSMALLKVVLSWLVLIQLSSQTFVFDCSACEHGNENEAYLTLMPIYRGDD